MTNDIKKGFGSTDILKWQLRVLPLLSRRFVCEFQQLEVCPASFDNDR